MTVNLEINGLKCLNQHHFADAEAIMKRPVTDSYTMNAFYDKSAEKVTLKCYWCDYEVEVDVSIRPVQLKQFSGEYLTIGPPCKEVV